MSDPRCREGRPGEKAAIPEDRATARVSLEANTALARVARRDFWRQVDQRRRWARALDAYLADVCPPPEPRRPSTFGLSAEDVRAEFDRLTASGWTPGEVRAVLAVSVPERAR